MAIPQRYPLREVINKRGLEGDRFLTSRLIDFHYQQLPCLDVCRQIKSWCVLSVSLSRNLCVCGRAHDEPEYAGSCLWAIWAIASRHWRRQVPATTATYSTSSAKFLVPVPPPPDPTKHTLPLFVLGREGIRSTKPGKRSESSQVRPCRRHFFSLHSLRERRCVSHRGSGSGVVIARCLLQVGEEITLSDEQVLPVRQRKKKIKEPRATAYRDKLGSERGGSWSLPPKQT